MKKFTVGLLAVLLIVPAISGCGGNSAPQKPDSYAPLPGSASEAASSSGKNARQKAQDTVGDGVEPLN